MRREGREKGTCQPAHDQGQRRVPTISEAKWGYCMQACHPQLQCHAFSCVRACSVYS